MGAAQRAGIVAAGERRKSHAHPAVATYSYAHPAVTTHSHAHQYPYTTAHPASLTYASTYQHAAPRRRPRTMPA